MQDCTFLDLQFVLSQKAENYLQIILTDANEILFFLFS